MSARRYDFLSLREELLRDNKLFVDGNFPPDNRSLTYNGNSPSGLRSVVWRRAKDIVRSPRFIVQGATRFDLDQGYLGDCWFIAGSSLVALHKSLLERCVPTNQSFGQDYAGIFHFNFWWYGKWTEVIIDDYLPIDENNRLIYAKNREEPEEFWAALLEKAYAKLHGCYQALDGGRLANALIDLTGGISETIDLTKKSEMPPNLFDTLYRSWKMNSFLGCSISRPPNATSREVKLANGLYMGHAYGINKFIEVVYQSVPVKLCRLRNPWGRTEWNGSWSDNSPQVNSLTSESKKMLGIEVRDDGEFWMPFNDLIENFEEIEMCHLQPDGLTSQIAASEHKRQWNVTVFHDAWIKGVTAGGCGNSPYQDLYWSNPQFSVTLKDPDETDNQNLCTMIVSLMEKEKGGKSNIAIGFDIYKLKDPQRNPLNNESAPRNALILKKRSGSYQYSREINRRFELPVGIYVIIPSTFRPNDEAEFMLRIFTEKIVESSVLDEESGPSVPVPKPVDPIKETFLRCAGEEGKLYASELKQFLLEMSTTEFKTPLKFSTEACRSLLTLVDRNQSGALSFDEAVRAWQEVKAYTQNRSGHLSLEETQEVWKLVVNRKAVFEQFDKDGSRNVDTFELGKMFSTLGFPISRKVLTAVVRRYGGKNQKLNIKDFIIVISKLTLMYQIFKDKQEETGDGDTEYAKFTMNEFLYSAMFC